MAQDKEEKKAAGKTNLTSGFWSVFLIIFAAFLTLAGPTYMVYAFNNVLKIDYATSMISGIMLFIIGLAIILYLVKKKILT